MNNDEIIKKAGTNWSQERGTMRTYIESIIEITRKDERESIAEVLGEVEIKIGDDWVPLGQFIRTRKEK